MHIDKLTLLGAGGHCSVVLDALMECGQSLDRINLLDESLDNKHQTRFSDLPITSHSFKLLQRNICVHLCLGDIDDRKLVLNNLAKLKLKFLSITHPRAYVSKAAKIGDGVFIAAKAVVSANATLEDNAIINHGAIVDHDCFIGKNTHVAPNSTLGGGVKISDNVLIGSSATILPNVFIASNAVIGSGAVVVRDISSPGTYAGIPAKKIVF
jgi:sugar O-acyltransferase (sialic acid O-acetyltransferase NeuD family)